MVKIGEVYDDYVVVRDLGRKNNQRYFLMRCNICGHEKACGSSNVTRQDNHHGTNNCKYDYYKQFIGKVINDYKIADITNRDGAFVAKFICTVCGHTKEMNVGKMNNSGAMSHNPSSCEDDYWNNLIGKEFGDFLITKAGDDDPKHKTFICKCKKCGTETERTYRSIINGRGMAHGVPCIKVIPDDEYKKVIQNRFQDMSERCNNLNNTNYAHYGGRGIRLKYDYAIDLYYDFIDELKEHASKYGINNSTFDRIDVNGDYEKSNLRITTMSVQNSNTRRRRFFLAYKEDNVVLCDSTGEFSRKYGVPASAIGNAIRKRANGKDAKSFGWIVKSVWGSLTKEEVEKIIVAEGVTTKLLVTL